MKKKRYNKRNQHDKCFLVRSKEKLFKIHENQGEKEIALMASAHICTENIKEREGFDGWWRGEGFCGIDGP